MGQRTHFVIVAEDKINNRARVSIYYNHWGIGRIMPSTLMTVTPNIQWGYEKWCNNRSVLDYAVIDYKHLGYVLERTLNYTNGTRITKSKSAPKKFEDWKISNIAGEYMRNFDNNNGCLFLFITYYKDANDDFKTDYEIAWMIGSEDAYRPEWKSADGFVINARNEENKKFGECYLKWLNTSQWMSLDVNNRWWTYDNEFKELFNRFLAYWNIKPHKNPQKTKKVA